MIIIENRELVTVISFFLHSCILGRIYNHSNYASINRFFKVDTVLVEGLLMLIAPIDINLRLCLNLKQKI